MLSMIVAVANNNVIGKDNNLIWHIPEDLKRFKRITEGKTMVTKLSWLLGCGYDYESIKQMMVTSFRGEIDL